MRRWWIAELAASVLAMGVATVPYLVAGHDGSPSPSGLYGHGLGIVGVLLMLVAEFAYSWRKRPTCFGPGPVSRWMQLHVFCGLVGPYLTFLHSAFRFQGLAGVLMLLVGVIVVSGMIGRYARAAAGQPAGERKSLWYLMHVPLSAALFVLAIAHVVGALWFGNSVI